MNAHFGVREALHVLFLRSISILSQFATFSGPAASTTWVNQSSSSLASQTAAQNLKDMRTQIYCDSSPGSLLAVVQMSNLFPDCKTFVDMPLKKDAGKFS
jgi:hypothetical protein